MPKIKPPIINGVAMLTLRETADKLGYTMRWIYHLVYTKQLNAVKRGNCWFFYADEVDKHLPHKEQTDKGLSNYDAELAAEV